MLLEVSGWFRHVTRVGKHETKVGDLTLPESDIAENRGSIVSILEEQIVNQGTVILPTENATCCLLTKYSAAEFILQNIAEGRNKQSDECLFACNAGSVIPIIEITRILANYHGLDMWSDLEIKFIENTNMPLDLTPQTA